MKSREVKKKRTHTDTKKIVIIAVTLTLLAIVLLSITFVSTGEAFLYKFKTKLALAEPFYFKDGCYIKINNDAAYWLTTDKEECQSLFIALTHAGKKNFYRLLYSLGYPNAPVSQTGLNLINAGEAEKVTLTNTNNKLTLLYSQKGSFDYFESIKPKFSASSCQELEFFWVKLYCFNEVPGKKASNLQQIIAYLTVLKYTSNQKVTNGLIGQEVFPIDFIVSDNIKYYDASVPELYEETLESVKCLPEQGSANYQLYNGENRVYLCQKFLEDEAKLPQKLNNVAILYHEANHKYQEGHSYDINCTKTNGENTGDKDFSTVYGTHINYLFSISQNIVLPCDWRIFAFEQAEKELKTKLCQKPIAPKHGFAKPVCG